MTFTNDKPIFQQMADRLEDEILGGTYHDDDRIPSVREYAVMLEVNTNTAVKAYEQLARENIIYNKRGLGYYVTPGARSKIQQQRRGDFLSRRLPELFRQMRLLDLDMSDVAAAWEAAKRTLMVALLVMTAATMWGQSDTNSVARDSMTVPDDSVTWSKALDGVVVKAQRQLIRQEIDRTSYDVQGDEEAKTQTVLDMLRKVPMVSVDGQDNIQVRGNSSYRIYRNGHYDPNLSRNAKEVLKAMPASAVKRVEVITDPGAREDAEGVGAILNIVMAENKVMDGVTGTLTAGYTTPEEPNLGGYVTTQLGKAIVSVDFGYNNMSKKGTRNVSDTENNYVESGNSEAVHIDGTNAGHVFYGAVNASYDIDSLNLLSASFGGYFYQLDIDGDASTAMYDSSRTPLYSYDEHYWMPGYGHHSWNGRLDYEHKTRMEGEQLTLSYMLALTRQHTERETNYTTTQQMPVDYTGFLQKAREHFTEHTFQTDYIRPLWKGHRLEVGAKYINRSNNSHNSQQFYAATDVLTTDDFDHTTHIVAGYADYLYNKAKWSARAGLRYEYSYMKGAYPDGRGTDFDKHLGDWVPQASVKYQMDGRRSLKLGYATSINRPGITYLNPAVVSSARHVDYGNAHLVSARWQTLSLTYMYVGQRLTLQVVPQLSYVTNALGSMVYVRDDVRYCTWDNCLRQHRWQVEGYAQWKPFDGTTLVANINFTDNDAKNTEAALHQHTTSAFYYANLSQQLPWKLRLTAYAYGQAGHSAQTIYAYSEAWQQYAFALQRSFMKDDRLTLRLTASNPFNKHMHFKTRTTQGDILSRDDSWYNGNGRTFEVSLSYRFGRLAASVKKTDVSIENSDLVGGIERGK